MHTVILFHSIDQCCGRCIFSSVISISNCSIYCVESYCFSCEIKACPGVSCHSAKKAIIYQVPSTLATSKNIPVSRS